MQNLNDNQEILNSVFDKQNGNIRTTSKSGDKKFIQYYIDNDKLSQMLPIQIILNSIFDRQTSSLCLSNSDSQSTNINVVNNDGNNVISNDDSGVTIGNSNSVVTINASDISINGNGINTPNGFVKLNNQGYVDNQYIRLDFDPSILQVVNDINDLQNQNVQITIKDTNGTYKSITLSQLQQFCYPKFQILG